MFDLKNYSPVLAAVALCCLPVSADAVIVQADANNPSNRAAFDGNISTTDLINNGTSTLGSFNANVAASFSTDGAHDGDAIHNSGLAYWGGGNSNGGNVVLTYTLAGSATGYDIDTINTIYGWNDSAERHMAQRYDVQIATVSNPTFTNLHSVVYDPFTANNFQASTQVTLTNNGGGPLDNGGGVVATGVTGIRFLVSNDPGGSEVGVIREYDVFGAATAAAVPEPSTLSLTALGMLSLGLIGWRRRRR